MDLGQRRLAERRLVHALQRLHRREPLAADFRVDALVDAARAVPRAASGHRGSAALVLTDAELRSVVEELVASGRMERHGHRVRLRNHQPAFDAETRQRVDRLMDGLRETGNAPPRVDGIAARLGITPPLLAQLRRSGQLVSIGPGIDYPADVWQQIQERVDRLGGALNVARVRDELRTTRRHAEAILAHRRAARQRVHRDRRAVR
ncbi:MAG TPA: hypothetical protein VHU77_02525 [Candidatus Limnocylindria bacterium]|jgi:hypothetical protein|nr:hypothetical protein [Candidatus Limnocylindria bacterium]